MNALKRKSYGLSHICVSTTMIPSHMCKLSPDFPLIIFWQRARDHKLLWIINNTRQKLYHSFHSMWPFGLRRNTCFLRSTFSSFFFFFLHMNSNFTWVYCLHYVHHCLCTVYTLKNIKNGSHDIIYTFKNYFAIVFSVFSFQQQ